MDAHVEDITATAGSRTLFFDMAEIEERHNVVQRVMKATKHPSNPVLPLGDVHEWDSGQARPWESRSVIYDEEERLFKCWYAGTDLTTDRWWATGYATSQDGVYWEKPRAGLFEYNGSKDNNIVLMGWGPVLKDTREPDATKRYKMIVRGSEKGVPGGETRAAYSADGIHWTKGERIELPEYNDIVVLVRDDLESEPARRYKIIWQSGVPANKPGPKRVRAKFLAYGPDIEHFTVSPANPVLTPNDSIEQENHFLMLFPWRKWRLMLYECGWYLPNGTGNFGAYCADIRLAASRDGERFQRVLPNEKVIARGERGEWDAGFLVISDKPAVKDDTVYLYYCGNGEDWTGWPRGNTPAQYKFRSTGCVRLSRMGLATLKMDRFTCLETSDREIPGTATTQPIRLAGHDLDLVINVSEIQQRRSWVTVEALDSESGRLLDGFTKDDCVKSWRDDVCAPIRWRTKRLADLPVSRAKLRFHLYGAARLHAFGFERL